eukprot:CAMPEP_0182842592 /NCGR_PEP_ID=MMETSP0006_2-20121128/25709_1 /TAXON_ID=97485 /ORGANISM="Prymnesium parvum, Strain Texoma1" /LENGTH=55 /DNA_ID=CAMNT_0024972273 /DNA_START=15 /DNA_END=179 /DNA_ORIENTATION=-
MKLMDKGGSATVHEECSPLSSGEEVTTRAGIEGKLPGCSVSARSGSPLSKTSEAW